MAKEDSKSRPQTDGIRLRKKKKKTHTKCLYVQRRPPAMPVSGSDLEVFLLAALLDEIYINLFYVDDSKETFCLYCPRKDSTNYTPENIKIFEDWDERKGHEFNYTESRQRLLQALKGSVYLVLVSNKKDTYVFRFSSPEERAMKREARKKKEYPPEKYASDGESLPASPESLCSLPSPGDVNHFSPVSLYDASSPGNPSSPGDFMNIIERTILESHMPFSDEVENSSMVKVAENHEICALDPSFSPSLPGDVGELLDMYLNDSEMEIFPDLPDSLVSSMDHEPSVFPEGTIVEQPNTQVNIQDLTQVASSSGETQNQLNLGSEDIQAIQAVFQVIHTNSAGLQGAGTEPVYFLVNDYCLVTIRRSHLS